MATWNSSMFSTSAAATTSSSSTSSQASSTFGPANSLSQISRLLPTGNVTIESYDQIGDQKQLLYAAAVATAFNQQDSRLQQMLDAEDTISIGMMNEMEEGGISMMMSNGNYNYKKKRLEANQVRLLERSFKEEKKLEPERKIQIAQELGLEPRQVAIWFQNRRARSKSKQLEKDYTILKALYNSTVLEKQRLQEEVIHLRKELKKVGYVENRMCKSKQLREIDVNSKRGKYVEQHEASTYARDSLLQEKEGKDESSTILPFIYDIGTQHGIHNYTTSNGKESDIVLSTSKASNDALQPHYPILVGSNLTHVSIVEHISEDYQHLSYANQECIADNNHQLKLNYTWHDIWSD